MAYVSIAAPVGNWAAEYEAGDTLPVAVWMASDSGAVYGMVPRPDDSGKLVMAHKLNGFVRFVRYS